MDNLVGFNLNDYVLVKIKDDGIVKYVQDTNAILPFKSHTSFREFKSQANADGYHKVQFHWLLENYGNLGLGVDQYINVNILIESKYLKPQTWDKPTLSDVIAKGEQDFAEGRGTVMTVDELKSFTEKQDEVVDEDSVMRPSGQYPLGAPYNLLSLVKYCANNINALNEDPARLLSDWLKLSRKESTRPKINTSVPVNG